MKGRHCRIGQLNSCLWGCSLIDNIETKKSCVPSMVTVWWWHAIWLRGGPDLGMEGIKKWQTHGHTDTAEKKKAWIRCSGLYMEKLSACALNREEGLLHTAEQGGRVLTHWKTGKPNEEAGFTHSSRDHLSRPVSGCKHLKRKSQVDSFCAHCQHLQSTQKGFEIPLKLTLGRRRCHSQEWVWGIVSLTWFCQGQQQHTFIQDFTFSVHNKT